MQYAIALLAAAAGVSAMHSNVTVVTEVVESYTTFCPEPTEITHGTLTYTVTEPTTLTITDCPCTITKPIMTTSEVICHECPPEGTPTEIITVPTQAPPPPPETPVQPPPQEPTEEVPPVPTAGAGKAAVPVLAGLAGLVAFAL